MNFYSFCNDVKKNVIKAEKFVKKKKDEIKSIKQRTGRSKKSYEKFNVF